MPDLTIDTISDAAQNPASASVDGQSAAIVPISDQIKALDKAAGAAAMSGTNDNGGSKSGWNRLRTARAVPPGAV